MLVPAPAFPVPWSNRGRGSAVQCRMTYARRDRLLPGFVIVLVLNAAAASGVYAQNPADNERDAERLIKVMGVKPGSVIAEIGAGDGQLTVALAKAVGPTGRLYSNELNKDRLAAIRNSVDAAGLQNVTIVEGKEDVANLAEQCCDG